MLMPPITVVIMAGGPATRIGGKDKLMISLGGPLLSYIASHFLRHELVREVVIAAGSRYDIRDYFKTWPLVRVLNLESIDTGSNLLQTVGAIKTPHILGLNGDTVLSLDLDQMYKLHEESARNCTVALTSKTGLHMQNTGAFKVADDNRILYSAEADAAALADAPTVPTRSFSATGAILYRRDGLAQADIMRGAIGLPRGKLSTEKHLVPWFIRQGEAMGFDNGMRPLLDIGTYPRMNAFIQAGQQHLLSVYGPPTLDVHV